MNIRSISNKCADRLTIFQLKIKFSLKFIGLPARDDASNSETTSYHDFEKRFIEHLPKVLPA